MRRQWSQDIGVGQHQKIESRARTTGRNRSRNTVVMTSELSEGFRVRANKKTIGRSKKDSDLICMYSQSFW